MTRCEICKQEIDPQQTIIQCPSCHSDFHEQHLMIWLTYKTRCTICRVSIYTAGPYMIELVNHYSKLHQINVSQNSKQDPILLVEQYEDAIDTEHQIKSEIRLEIFVIFLLIFLSLKPSTSSKPHLLRLHDIVSFIFIFDVEFNSDQTMQCCKDRHYLQAIGKSSELLTISDLDRPPPLLN